MFKQVACIILGAPVLLAGASIAQAQPLDAFSRLPAFEGVKISPHGGQIAAPCPASDAQRICVFDLEAGGPPLTVPITDGLALTDFYFASPDHLLVRTSFEETLNTSSGLTDYKIDRAVIIEVNTQQAASLMSNIQSSTSNANVVSLNRGDPDSVLVEMTLLEASRTETGSNIEREARYENRLYRVDLSDGRGRRVAVDNSLYRVVNPDGEIEARVYHDIQTGEFQVRRGERRGEVLYEAVHDYNRPIVSGFTDETGLAFTMETELGRGVFRLDLETGEISDPFGFSERPFQRPLYDRYDQLWGFLARSGDTLVQRIVDPELRADQDALSDALGAPIMIEGFSDDRDKIIFHIAEPGTPRTYYIFERDKGEVGLLSSSYPELSQVELPQRRMIRYAASDGLTIPAVLTTPAGLGEGEAAPLVVMPHGGPAARDGVEFDWWAQAIAAQGYLVLQPNFRGSDGYGPAFREAGFGEFGGRMIDDILDGARHLQAEGLARPGSFCLTGGSYGGYAALMGAVRAPDEVGCVVAFAPVTNPVGLLGRSSGEGSENALAFWEEYIGSRFEDRQSADSISVLRRADALTMPVLVMHGAIDAVVPVEESEALARVMGERESFTYVELDNEIHYLDLPTSRADLLNRSLSLFERTLGPVD